MPSLSMALSLPGARGTAGSVDPAAAAFFAKAAALGAPLISPVVRVAVNQLAVDLRRSGLLGAYLVSHIKALYPFAGGNSTSHSLNLVDPDKHRITWGGTVTHSANGITGDGATGYGDTGFLPSLLSEADAHLSLYSREAIASTGIEISARQTASNNAFDLWACDAQSRLVARVFNSTFIVASISPGGYFISTRTGVTHKGYRNAVEVGSDTNTPNASTGITVPISVLCESTDVGRSFFSAKNLALVSIGRGLTAQNVSDFTIAVRAFQIALGRSV